jgi:predicted permease
MPSLGLSSYSEFARRCSGLHRLLNMEIPETAAILLSLLVIVTFVFLLGLARGFLSERQQTAGWIIFGVVFFSLCSVFFRSSNLPGNRTAPAELVSRN